MDDITKYRKCGWDFDGVLWRHENSHHFWDYILENPHQQEHFIITFRTGRLFDRLWFDLARTDCPLLPFHFRGTFGVPEEHYNNFVLGLVGGDEYMFWKGWQCRELGIEVLVDDATMEVWAGCSKYEIDYIHPDVLGFETAMRIARDGEVH
ncbi:hypothetical protein [Erythrobacter westpacificensis]